MNLLQHCTIRIKNLEDHRDKPRQGAQLHPDTLSFIRKNILLNQTLIKMVKDNPHLRFETRWPEIEGEVF